MDTVKEGTRMDYTVTFKDLAGALAVPTTVLYSVYCLSTKTAIKTDVGVTPASSIVISLTGDDVAILGTNGRQYETRVLTVKTTYGGTDKCNDEIEYQVKNLDSVT